MSESSPARDQKSSNAEPDQDLRPAKLGRLPWLREHSEQIRQWGGRLAGHLLLVAIAFIAVWLSRSQPQPVASTPLAPQPEQRTVTVLAARGGPRPSEDLLFYRAPVPHTTVPERPRKGVITYTVEYGDTLYGIAQKFDISGDTVAWANPELEENPDLLRLGEEITILPISGVYHKVVKDDTFESIAQQYKVDPSAILECEYNYLGSPPVLTVGEYVIVPGGRKPYVPKVVHAYSGPIPEGAARGTGRFVWPTSGVITQRFWERHRALDIAWVAGTPIVASDSGFVAIVGSSDQGYGRYVVIDHGNGFQTLYAHFSVYYVKTGQSVKKGQTIGLMGSTGRSTGPHLHFEIRKDGVQRNPLNWLP